MESYPEGIKTFVFENMSCLPDLLFFFPKSIYVRINHLKVLLFVSKKFYCIHIYAWVWTKLQTGPQSGWFLSYKDYGGGYWLSCEVTCLIYAAWQFPQSLPSIKSIDSILFIYDEFWFFWNWQKSNRHGTIQVNFLYSKAASWNVWLSPKITAKKI